MQGSWGSLLQVERWSICHENCFAGRILEVTPLITVLWVKGGLNWPLGPGFILRSEKPALHAKPLPALPLLRWNSPHSAGRWVAGLRAWAQSPHVAVTTRPTLKSPWRRNGELIGEPTHPRFDVCLQTFSWVNYHLNNKQESELFQLSHILWPLCCLCLFNPVAFCQSWLMLGKASIIFPTWSSLPGASWWNQLWSTKLRFVFQLVRKGKRIKRKKHGPIYQRAFYLNFSEFWSSDRLAAKSTYDLMFHSLSAETAINNTAPASFEWSAGREGRFGAQPFVLVVPRKCRSCISLMIKDWTSTLPLSNCSPKQMELTR